MTTKSNPFLELKSERVQKELARLPNWQIMNAGLEGAFRFPDEIEALTFMSIVTDLLKRHRQPPRNLLLRGTHLNLALGGVSTDGVFEQDLEMANRISALVGSVGEASKETGAARS